MRRFIKSSALIPLLLLIIIATGCSSGFVSQKEETPPGVPTGRLVQSNSGGGVTIEAEWVKREGNSLVFRIAMDTHSVDLDQYDLGKLAVLKDDGGNKYRATSWEAPPGGHHRSGSLIFPRPDSLKEAKAKYIEIVIQDVAGVKERVLRWQL